MSAASWPVLVKSALLGTERTGRPAPDGGATQVGVLVDVLAGPGERSPERVLLAAAAVVATARRAGRLPDRAGGGAPEPAPPVDSPPVSEQATRSLGALLGGTGRQLLPEWLETCGALGRRVPSIWLPAVLEAATATRALRPAALAAVGARGRWLARQRPEWGWAVGAAAGEVPDDPLAAWAEGTAAERRALLTAARRVDGALGRTLVLATWKVDRAEDRAAFVELLGTDLSMDDEPFLEEQALTDRARDVRRAAAAALARLPASRLAARMEARVAAHVRLERAGPPVLEVRLPDDLPARWAADGVDRQPRRGMGERAWWLAQVVAATPLDHWDDPAVAVAAAATAEQGEAVLRGWAVAASRQQRPDWATALLVARSPGLPDDASGLLQVLDPPARAAWLAGALERAPRRGAAPFLTLAAEVPRPWPAPLVRAVAGRAAAAVMDPGPGAHAARPALLLLAERADPTTLPRLTADLADAMQADRRLEAELRRPLALAQLRHDLLAELC